MWARSVQVMLGVWLLLSLFVFRATEQLALRISDIVCGLLIIMLSLASYRQRLRRAHLLVIGVGAWLAGFAFIMTHAVYGFSATGAAQNEMILGYVLVILAIIPNKASLPPDSWRAYLNGELAHKAE